MAYARLEHETHMLRHDTFTPDVAEYPYNNLARLVVSLHDAHGDRCILREKPHITNGRFQFLHPNLHLPELHPHPPRGRFGMDAG